jgi:hypothetical protein
VIPGPVEALWCVAWWSIDKAEHAYFFNELDARKFKGRLTPQGLFSICWRTEYYSAQDLLRRTSAQ